MVKGSLDKNLFDIPHSQRLSWKQRQMICIGIAAGVHYLHTGSKRLIIHGDLKSNNILLDANFIPKLSGFGVSKIGPISMSRNKLKRQVSRIVGTYGYMQMICIGIAAGVHYLHTGSKRLIIHGNLMPNNILLDANSIPKLSGFECSKIGPISMSRNKLKRQASRILSTIGYVAPEYVSHRIKTEKVDVYSFGIMLLEVLVAKCIHKIILELMVVREIDLYHLIEAETMGGIIDPSIISEIAPNSPQIFLKLMQDCLAYEAVQRPSMGEVEVGLRKALHLQETPHAATEHVDSGAHGANHNA